MEAREDRSLLPSVTTFGLVVSRRFSLDCGGPLQSLAARVASARFRRRSSLTSGVAVAGGVMGCRRPRVRFPGLLVKRVYTVTESQLHLLELLGGFFRDLLGRARPSEPIFGARELAAPTSPPVTRRYMSTIWLGSNFSNFLAVSFAMSSPIFLGARPSGPPVTRTYTSTIWLGSSFGGIAVLRGLKSSYDFAGRASLAFVLFLRLGETQLGLIAINSELLLATDGSIDIGISHVMSWSIWIWAAVLILQSSEDACLAEGALVFAVSPLLKMITILIFSQSLRREEMRNLKEAMEEYKAKRKEDRNKGR
ncbi:hypothetical protein Bca4012_029239 [Brassica carinata]